MFDLDYKINWIKTIEFLPLKEISRSARKIAKVMEFLHSSLEVNSIMHPDLKPYIIGRSFVISIKLKLKLN